MRCLVCVMICFGCVTSAGFADEKDQLLARQLAEVVRDSKASVWSRIEAANTLAKLGVRGAAAVPDLTSELGRFRRDEHSSLQEAIVRAMGQIGAPAKTAVPAMTRAVGQNVDIDKAVKESINLILGAPEDLEVPLLIQQLKHRDESLRLRAAKALAKFGTGAKSALSELILTLGDSDPDVRRAALNSIRIIDPTGKPTDAMVNVYVLDLKDPDETIRLRAAKALGRLGPAASSAASALEALLNDPDRDVRRAALDAMNKITPP